MAQTKRLAVPTGRARATQRETPGGGRHHRGGGGSHLIVVELAIPKPGVSGMSGACARGAGATIANLTGLRTGNVKGEAEGGAVTIGGGGTRLRSN